jgi:hypothetical protein
MLFIVVAMAPIRYGFSEMTEIMKEPLAKTSAP